MFSATFPTEIQRIASKYLYLVVGMVGGACSDVTQELLQVPKFHQRHHR
jgi:probable ATP-dependent RNA helicase DDX4